METGMKFFILTDLEGVAGIDSFTQTRTRDLAQKGPAMRQLARETNACIEGIRSVHSDAQIDVWDGHGSGGLHAEELIGGNYLRGGRPYNEIRGYDALLFVGQHAMAGTIAAPLCHTYSSLHVAYYRLNGVFIGEFGGRATVAGAQGVPTIYLSGDDKAAMEARMFVPQIQTAVVKWGRGLEAAEHMDPDEACRVVRDSAAAAVQRRQEIPPFTFFQPPYVLEMRYYEPADQSKRQGPGVTWVDERTVRIETDTLADLPF
jgi:D-amino peptidase